jgi:hypothetical protein
MPLTIGLASDDKVRARGMPNHFDGIFVSIASISDSGLPSKDRGHTLGQQQ